MKSDEKPRSAHSTPLPRLSSKDRKRVRKGAIAAVLGTALILTGCAPADSAPPAESSEGQSGTLRFGITVPLDNWEPLFSGNSTYSKMVYEGLVTIAPDGATLTPELATEWDETPESLTFTLREGVVFHDGTPFNADAVVTNLERMFTTDGSLFAALVDPGTTVEALGDYEVRINLPVPAPSLIANLARSNGYIVSPAALASGTHVEAPVGTGPYQYSPEDSTAGSVTVGTYFEDYYAPEAVKPSQVEIHYIADAASIMGALQAGQIDVGYALASMTDQAKASGLEISTFPANLVHLQMYDTANTFKDKKVRQAICSAMDTSKFRQALYGGAGGDYFQRFQEGAVGYNPSVKGYPYDLERAKKLMQEAGNPKVEFTLINYDSLRPIVEVFRSQMDEIGVTVNAELPTFGQFFTSFRDGSYPATLFSDSTSASIMDYYAFKYRAEGPGNPYKVKNHELDKIAKAASLAPTSEEREELWREFTQYVNDEALDCGFYDNTYFWAFNPDTVSEPVSTRYVPAVFQYELAEIK